MSNTLLVSASGHTATLGSLAIISAAPGETEIRREICNDWFKSPAAWKASIWEPASPPCKSGSQSALAIIDSCRYGGQYKEQQKSFSDLLIVLLLALLLLFAVLLFEFRTFSAPTAILASAVLSTAGALLALLATKPLFNSTFNVASFMGMIMVIGIVAKTAYCCSTPNNISSVWACRPRRP